MVLIFYFLRNSFQIDDQKKVFELILIILVKWVFLVCVFFHFLIHFIETIFECFFLFPYDVEQKTCDEERTNQGTNNNTNNGTSWQTATVLVQGGRKRDWKSVLTIIDALRKHITFTVLIIGDQIDSRLVKRRNSWTVVGKQLIRNISAFRRSFVQNQVDVSI